MRVKEILENKEKLEPSEYEIMFRSLCSVCAHDKKTCNYKGLNCYEKKKFQSDVGDGH
jgi:hypothetical protein